jgi:SpoVK/Ycf46/Vps4 family AAA+-type ATPase
MNTNRLDSIDPAVRRRAAAVFEFQRPTREQRVAVLRAGLEGTKIAAREIEALADLTGPRGQGPGFTYSDLSQRLIPAIVLDAFPDRPITGTQALEVAKQTQPTPSFRGSANG